MRGFALSILFAWLNTPFTPPWPVTAPGPHVEATAPHHELAARTRPRRHHRRLAPRLIAIRAALRQLGVPYRWGGMARRGFDCSGLVRYAWARAGVWLPRTTYGQIRAGRMVANLAHARPGDILFPTSGHEQLYLGGGRIVEAAHTGTRVRIKPTRRYYIAIRRPAP